VFVKDGQILKDPNNRDWRKALSQAGIENFRWHDLRHTWASWHVQNGTPLYVLKELGGWKALSMVEKYAHLAPDNLAQYVDNIRVTENSHGTNTEQAA
jgi:integrase